MAEIVIPNSPILDPEGVKRRVANFARESGKRAVARGSTVHTKAHKNVMDRLATLVEGLDNDDSRLGMFFDAYTNGAGAKSIRDEFLPGKRSGRCLANAGQTTAKPAADELFLEFLRKSQADLIAAQIAMRQKAVKEAEQRARLLFETKATQEAERKQAKLDKSEARRRELEAQLAELRTELAHRPPAIEGDDAEPEPKAKPEKPKPKAKRRESVPGVPGVHRTARGLEIGYKLDGKQKWESLGDVSVDEAVAARALRIANARGDSSDAKG